MGSVHFLLKDPNILENNPLMTKNAYMKVDIRRIQVLENSYYDHLFSIIFLKV